jgi:ATP-dependent Lon protease
MYLYPEFQRILTTNSVRSKHHLCLPLSHHLISSPVAILSELSPTNRLKLATTLFTKHTSISEVSKKIASAVDESLSRQQKEFFLRQQLAAIQRELQLLISSGNNARLTNQSANGDSAQPANNELDDDDAHEVSDLAELKAKIEAMLPGSEERKMGVREWRRLKRIPAGSVENGVIRSYVNPFFNLPQAVLLTIPP